MPYPWEHMAHIPRMVTLTWAVIFGLMAGWSVMQFVVDLVLGIVASLVWRG